MQYRTSENAGYKVALAAFLLLALHVQISAAADGQIADVTYNGQGLVVKGTVFVKSLWLGCTLFPDEGYREKDLLPVQVHNVFAVKFPCAPALVNNPSSIAERGNSVPYSVCLWGKRVPKGDCARQNGGTPCEYCRKNGFHLENRVDRQTGNWSASFGQ